VDNELSDDQELAVTGHIKSCPDCTCLADDYRHIGQHVARGYRHATAGLSERIRASIKREKLVGLTLGCVGAMHRAAVLLFATGLSAPATALALRSSQEQASLEREILTAHVRSLVQDRPIQFASSDDQTVHIVAKGCNVLTWSAAGSIYWAVSHLNASEMGDLQKRLCALPIHASHAANRHRGERRRRRRSITVIEVG